MTTRRPHLAALAAVTALSAAVLSGCTDPDRTDDEGARQPGDSTSSEAAPDVPVDTESPSSATPPKTESPSVEPAGDPDASGVCATLTPDAVAAATDGLLTEYELGEPGLLSSARCQYYDADLTTFAVVSTWPLATPADWEALSTRAVAPVLDGEDVDTGLGEGSFFTVGTGVTGGPAAEAGFTVGDTGYTISYSSFGDATAEEAEATTRTVLELVADQV